MDLTDVDFLGSAELGTLVADQRREPLRRVVGHNRPIIRPLQLTASTTFSPYTAPPPKPSPAEPPHSGSVNGSSH